MAKKNAQAPALKIAPTVQVASVLHQQFQQLGCYQLVIGQLKAGFSLEHVRKGIQEVHGEWVGIAPAVVIERLSKLRHELSAVDLVASYLPGYVEAAAQQIEDGLNELEEIKWLYGVQKERIMMGYNLEKNLKIPNRYTGVELRLAKDLLESSVEIRARIGGVRGGAVEDTPRPVMAPKFDPKSSNKILNAVKLLTQKASG